MATASWAGTLSSVRISLAHVNSVSKSGSFSESSESIGVHATVKRQSHGAALLGNEFFGGPASVDWRKTVQNNIVKHTSSGSKRNGVRGRNVWRMEVADPLENYRNSFGNECAVERSARAELERTDAYKKLVVDVKEMKEQLKRLVAKEQFEVAASLRDSLNMLEFRKRLMELSIKPQVLYRVGDLVVHRRYGYHGVIYGHDPQCSAPKDWQDAMKIALLPQGQDQPFYHVLVDTRDRPGGMSTYVAQENVVLQKSGRVVMHPWIPKFFVGFQDNTYLPSPKLRQVYPNDW